MQQSVVQVENQDKLLRLKELDLFVIDLLGTALHKGENLLEIANKSELSVLALHVLPA